MPSYRRMKKWGEASIIHHLSLHQCHKDGDSELKEQGSGLLKLQKQKGMFLVICHTFCVVDGTVKRYNLALGNIFQDHNIRSVRFISTSVFAVFFKVLVLLFFMP